MKAVELFKIAFKRTMAESAMKQYEVAEKAGVGVKHLSDFLNGRAKLGESARERIAEVLGFTYIEFLEKGMDKDAQGRGSSIEVGEVLGAVLKSHRELVEEVKALKTAGSGSKTTGGNSDQDGTGAPKKAGTS